MWAIVEEKLNNYSFTSLESMTRKLLWIWNRIPKSICRNLIDSFDKKLELLGKKRGERVNKRKFFPKKSNFSWRNAYLEDNNFNIVYNEKILENMKKNKIKSLNKQLKDIKNSFTEEKKRYCIKNKNRIKKESKDLWKFFLEQEEKMIKIFEEKIKKKKEEIQIFKELDGKDLFSQFSLEEKINNISLKNKKKNLSTNNLK